MTTRHHNDGLTKRCGCPRPRWSKCERGGRVQRSNLVSFRLPPRGAHARLCAVQPLRNRRREEEVHLVQHLHVGVPPRHRRHELREQGDSHAGSAVRALLGLRWKLSHRHPRVRQRRRRGRHHLARFPGGERGARARGGLGISSGLISWTSGMQWPEREQRWHGDQHDDGLQRQAEAPVVGEAVAARSPVPDLASLPRGAL